MFFALLGKFVTRAWPAILLVWVLALVLALKFAPPWEKVTRSGEIVFLPETEPSRRADKLFKTAFKLEYSQSNVAIVVARGNGPLSESDKDFVKGELAEALDNILDAYLDADEKNKTDKNPIANIYTLKHPHIGALLVSEDKQATVALVELNKPFQDPANVPLLKQVEGALADLKKDKKNPGGASRWRSRAAPRPVAISMTRKRRAPTPSKSGRSPLSFWC